jgi:transposase
MVIVDGGIATAENLALLRAEGFDYLVNQSRRQRTSYAREFAVDEDFVTISDREDREPVRVRLIQEHHEQTDQIAAYTEQVVLCKSGARGDKERAILSSAETRFLAAAQKLANRIANGRLSDEAKIHQAIGRLRAHHPRAQRYYEIQLIREQDKKLLRYTPCDDAMAAAQQLGGCYVLRTNRSGMDAQQLWRLYMTLLNAEDGFRCLKSDLGLRPNFHQKEFRVDGHVFISILAYQLWCFIRQRLRNTRDNRSWETIRRVLRTHCYATIVLPTKGGKTHRLRKASAPDQSQQQIYEVFGINWRALPKSSILMQ